jgi:hypothetical protein
MSKIYRSAQGNLVDMEKLRLANEDTIAVGNMKVNARGDQLGPGGRVVKSRNQVMKEYYQLNTPSNPRAAKPAHRTRERMEQPIEVPPVEMPTESTKQTAAIKEDILQFNDSKKQKKVLPDDQS